MDALTETERRNRERRGRRSSSPPILSRRPGWPVIASDSGLAPHAAQVGNFLKGALLAALPEVFALRNPTETLMEARYNAARAQRRLKPRKLSVPHELCISTGGEARAMQLRERLQWSNPSFVPCTEPPKPWTGWRDGGYWDE